MLKREELLKTPEYWFETFQNEIYRQVAEYLEKENMSQTALAEKLGVTKGYVSQIMKGEFNYTLKKLIELSLAVNKIPVIEFKQADKYFAKDIHEAPCIPLFPHSVNKKDASMKKQKSK